MISRRDFVQAGFAASAVLGAAGTGRWGRLAAQQRLGEDQILGFEDYGNVTLIHVTDLHAQTRPVWYREPSVNLGVGAARGRPPHLTGRAFLDHYGIAPGTPEAYAMTSEDFTALARAYGRMGGLDRVATVVRAIRAARPGAILLDGGDTWHGSWTALQTRGQDMVEAMTLLGVDAMTSHWEWTYGAERVQEIVAALPFPFLGANIFDAEWDEPAFDAVTSFERGGTRVAVIGQAFPYTPIANPGWMIPGYTFGIREARLQAMVDAARAGGAGLVVCLSHNGFDLDARMAARVRGIDVILSGHTHDAIPEPVLVGQTILIASGSNGKFVSRVDLDVRDGRMRGVRHKLIPVFSDVITPDPQMAALIDRHRAPYETRLAEGLGTAGSLLYRRGTFNGPWDDVICDAIRAERDVEIALSPGLRWGPTLLPGDPITFEDVTNATALTYGQCYRTTMTGAQIRLILEDVADNLFNPDPYYQQGGDMVRVGGLSYAIDIAAPMGRRISRMTLTATGADLDPERVYTVGGWASVQPGTEGPQIWDLVADHIRKAGEVGGAPSDTVTVTGA